MILYKGSRKKKEELFEEISHQHVDQLTSLPIGISLEENIIILEGMFQDCSDFVIRRLTLEDSSEAIAIFIDGLSDTPETNEALKALMILEGGVARIESIEKQILPVSQIDKVDNYSDLLQGVLSGDVGLIVNRNREGLLLGLRGGETRSVSEPETEAVIRGPREGLTENIRTNSALIRRKLKTPKLKMKPLKVGRESNTDVLVTYMEGIVDPATVKEVETRVNKIDIDAILESGYIEELIQDHMYSPFPQIQYSERPDTIAGSLLEGRIAILVDGTPMALVVPTTFWQLMLANEDYYERFQIATLLRWLRYTFVLIALLTPALYIAIITYHQDMIPTNLLLSIASAREAIPFPAIVEVLIMEVAFEALREAGIRLPKTIGQAVSILGALVIGTAAVEAGIVSAPMVIIVSITGIASFTIPHFNLAIAVRMLRFPLMLLAAVMGLYGLMIGVMFIVGHMASIRSFGVPYLSPVGPLSFQDLKDILIRSPWHGLKNRPSFMNIQDQHRMNPDLAQEITIEGGQTGKNSKKQEAPPK